MARGHGFQLLERLPDDLRQIGLARPAGPAFERDPEDGNPCFGRLGLPVADISAEDAGEHIVGYTIYNDWSARDYQQREMSINLGPGICKDFASSLGPCIATPDEFDRDRAKLTARVNGEQWTDSVLTMRLPYEEVIEWITQSLTIVPGDILSGGTVAGGCGIEFDRWLPEGALVELEAEGIGVLRNRVAAKGEFLPRLTMAGSLGVENRLRQALERDEFVLHYQPKVNIASGELTGAEALIRWNDPQTGLVPPGRFMPILEETGLIHEVGRWALAKALEDHQRWRRAGLPAVRIAVNVSPLQLRSRSFVNEIERAIGEAPDAASGLELELTESVIMENVSHNIVSLSAIRALGITIAIDDFGTGFSSLSYLSKLPLDTLKIDRSFVSDMVARVDGLTLVAVIINLAHALKLKVVAEGVETEEQLRELRLLSCDEMQGFLFGKPVPAAIFEEKYLSRPPSSDRHLLAHRTAAQDSARVHQPDARYDRGD